MAKDSFQGILALMVDRSLAEVEVHQYGLRIEGYSEEDHASQLTRQGANSLSFHNGKATITNLGDYELVSLTPLSQLECHFQGKSFFATYRGSTTLLASKSDERQAIKRLLNQELIQGAMKLAEDSQNNLRMEISSGNKVMLVQNEPSKRIQYRNELLEAFITLELTPELMADGTALVTPTLKHQLLANHKITMDWVIKNRPRWLPNIQKVRHCYLSPTQGKKLTVQFKGTAENETPNSELNLPQGRVTLLDYHLKAGNIHGSMMTQAKNSSVVKVKYHYSKPPALHLAALLQPIFDFETLSRIEPRLLEGIARKLKWPMSDRVKTTTQLIKHMRLPTLKADLVRIQQPERFMRKVPLNLQLQFHNQAIGRTEKDLIKFKAFKPMNRSLVAMLAIGENGNQQALQAHFDKIKARCLAWGAEPQIKWKQVPSARNTEELEYRLNNKQLPPSLLIIAIDNTVNKAAIRNIAFRYCHATQFLLLDHPSKMYNDAYYNNLAAGVFSKGGGIICSLDNMPGDAELFIGLDMGGTTQRVPGSAFLFNRNGAQLGWQLADAQSGERLSDTSLQTLIERSIGQFRQVEGGRLPKRVVLHRDGKFYESMDVIHQLEDKYGIGIDVLEIIKTGAPALLRYKLRSGERQWFNPALGDAFELVGNDEMILATYSGAELGSNWGNLVTVRPLRLRKRYGATDLAVMAEQVLALSRIHGASLYRHPRLPVTTHHADRFATLRQEANLDDLSRMDRMCPVYL